MIKGDEGRGSKGALNADEGEEDDPFKAKCLISPASNFRLRWDLLMLVLIMYNVIIIPVRICFEWEAVPSDFLFWMETSMDFTFLVDVVLARRVPRDHRVPCRASARFAVGGTGSAADDDSIMYLQPVYKSFRLR